MNEDDILYDETQLLEQIKKSMSLKNRGEYKDDQLLEVVDIIDDFYDHKGYLEGSESTDNFVNIDEDELVVFILDELKKKNLTIFSRDDVEIIVETELNYCESLEASMWDVN